MNSLVNLPALINSSSKLSNSVLCFSISFVSLLISFLLEVPLFLDDFLLSLDFSIATSVELASFVVADSSTIVASTILSPLCASTSPIYTSHKIDSTC
jgi:hypothetical protein